MNQILKIIINLLKECKKKSIAIPKITVYLPSKPRNVYKQISEKGKNVINIKKVPKPDFGLGFYNDLKIIIN